MNGVTKRWVSGLARGLGFRPHEVDDLHQEALLAALANPKHAKGDARFRILDIRRGRPYTGSPGMRHGQRVPVEITAGGTADKEDLLAYVAAERGDMSLEGTLDTELDVRAAVRRLPEQSKRVVWMRIWEERTWDEIAAVLGVSRRQVMQVWASTTETLREALA